MPKKKKMEIVIYLPPGAQEVAPGIWGWDAKDNPHWSRGPETDTPEEAEIRALVMKRQKEKKAQRARDRIVPKKAEGKK